MSFEWSSAGTARQHEVELVHARDHERDQEKHEQRRAAEDFAGCFQRREVLLVVPRRRCGQHETEDAHHHAEDAPSRRLSPIPATCVRDFRSRRALRVAIQQPLPDRNPNDDPADGAPDADLPELLVAIDEMMERKRVRQGKRRRIDDRVEDRINNQLAIARHIRQSPDEHGANEVAEAEELFRVEPAIGDLPCEERGDQRPAAPIEKSSAAFSGVSPR